MVSAGCNWFAGADWEIFYMHNEETEDIYTEVECKGRGILFSSLLISELQLSFWQLTSYFELEELNNS